MGNQQDGRKQQYPKHRGTERFGRERKGEPYRFVGRRKWQCAIEQCQQRIQHHCTGTPASPQHRPNVYCSRRFRTCGRYRLREVIECPLAQQFRIHRQSGVGLCVFAYRIADRPSACHCLRIYFWGRNLPSRRVFKRPHRCFGSVVCEVVEEYKQQSKASQLGLDDEERLLSCLNG